MRKRSKAREYALQILYQVDIRHGDAGQLIQEFWEGHAPTRDIKAFAEELVRGTTGHLGEIDPLLASYANNWSLKRMGMVDRNILRLGAFELLFVEEIPPKVSINEAVELAKRFGDAESGKFVNGILDAIHKKSPRPRDPSPAPGGGATPSAGTDPTGPS